MSLAGNQLETELFDEQVFAEIKARGFFTLNRPLWVARAPGRLDVMGGNVDYTGGMVLQSLLREATWVAAQPREDDVIRIFNPGVEQFGWVPYLELRVGDLSSPQHIRILSKPTEGSRWSCYVLGALYFLKIHHGWGSDGGVDIFIASDLPLNKGVSSSAALEIAVLKAASAAAGISLDGIALATAGQWTENIVVGSACGIMDQAAIVLGRKNHYLPMLCQPCVPLAAVALPEGFCIWGIDSMVTRSTTGTAYEVARAAGFIGYKLICQREGIDVVPDEASAIPRWTDMRWNGYLSNLAPSEFRARYEQWLPENLSGGEFLACCGEHVDPFTGIDSEIDYPVRAAVRYATEESFRVRTAHALLESAAHEPDNTMRLIGEILFQSHIAYTDCGLGSDDCDDLVSRTRQAGLPGAKMTGGGAGGVVAVLGRSEDFDTIQQVVQEYSAGRGSVARIFNGSSDGVDAFGVRVLYPTSSR